MNFQPKLESAVTGQPSSKVVLRSAPSTKKEKLLPKSEHYSVLTESLKEEARSGDTRSMRLRKQYMLGGQQVWGEEVAFEPERENFNTYILQDGTSIRFKAVVLKFIRLEQWDPEGNPIYMVHATNALVADVPDTLKRK